MGTSKVTPSTVSVDIHSSGNAKTEITSLPSTTNYNNNNNASAVGLAEESSTVEVDKIPELLNIDNSIIRDSNQNVQTPDENITQSTGITSTMLIDFDKKDPGMLLFIKC